MCAVMILGAGAMHWWWLMAAALVLGILTDLVDGPLARGWMVVSTTGATLHYMATTLLVACGVLAAVLGDVWPWWSFSAMVFSYAICRRFYGRFNNKWQALVTISCAVADVVILGALLTTFFGLWLHADYGTVGALVVIAGLFVAIAKAEDIRRAFDLAKNYAR